MRAVVFIILILAQLVWWDICDKARIAYSYSRTRRFFDIYVSNRARVLFGIARFTIGLRLKVDVPRGELPSRMVVVANHQSLIDIVAVMAALPGHSTHFVAKKELRRWFPAVSRVLRVQHHALIDRNGNYADAMQKIEHLGIVLTGRQCPVIFPEGTRSRDKEVHEFHAGAVRRLLRSAPIPIVALAIDGGAGVIGLADLASLDRDHVYRVSLAGVYHPPQTRQATAQAVADAQAAITRHLRVHR